MKRYIDLEKLMDYLKKYQNDRTEVAIAGIAAYAFPKTADLKVYDNEVGYGYFNVPLNDFIVELEDQQEAEVVKE